MKEITIKVNQFLLKDRASGKKVTVQTVLNLEELAALVKENEREEARWKVEEAIAAGEIADAHEKGGHGREQQRRACEIHACPSPIPEALGPTFRHLHQIARAPGLA
jgi:hypothetical protein